MTLCFEWARYFVLRDATCSSCCFTLLYKGGWGASVGIDVLHVLCIWVLYTSARRPLSGNYCGTQTDHRRIHPPITVTTHIPKGMLHKTGIDPPHHPLPS